VRLKNITCRRTARRNARRFFKVGIEHLQVMLRGDAFAVAEPRADDVSGEHFRQFGLSARSEVVPQSRPRGHARSLDDLLESSPQVDSLPIANSCGLTVQAGENPTVRINGLLESVAHGVE